MSTMLITTSAILLASAASSSHGGGGGSCPVSSFGVVCLIIVGCLIALSIITLILACTRPCFSKWGDRWFCTSIALWFAVFIPMIVGMIHDCQ